MIKWCMSWVLKMVLLVLAYAAILYGITTFSSEWASEQTLAILSKYSQGNWEAIGKSIAELFPFVSKTLDTIVPFLNLVKSTSIESPLLIVHDLTNALIFACVFKIFELIYQGIILPINNLLLGSINRLADIYASVVGAYSSLFITDIITIHTKSIFEKIYHALPFQLLPNLTVGTISVVGLVTIVLFLVVGFIWIIGRRSTSLMTALGKGFLDILLGLLVSAMIYLLAGTILALQLGSTMSYGTAAIIMISCILGITFVSAILITNSSLKFFK